MFGTSAACRNKVRAVLIGILCGVVAGLVGTLGGRPGILVAAEPSPRATLFDQVWDAVGQAYVDPEFGGVDWQRLREEYRDRVIQAPDDAAAYRLLNEMLSRLKDPGTTALDPVQAKELRTSQDRVEYVGVGMILSRSREGEVLVRQVVPRGPADRAGVRSGDRIRAVDGAEVHGMAIDRVASMIRGKEGTRAQLLIVRPDGAERRVEPARRAVTFKPEPHHAVLPGNVGYLYIPSFVEGMENQVLAHLRKLHRTDALILDLRDTWEGGSYQTLSRIAGLFMEKPIGGVWTRQGPAVMPAQPTWEGPGGFTALLNPPPTALDQYKKPIAVLVDESTQFEMLAMGLKEQGRAVVVGRPTVPDRGRSQAMIELPGGGLLLVTSSLFISPQGNTLGQGMVPDVAVPSGNLFTRGADRENDPDVDKALEVLAGGRSQKKEA